MAYRSLIVICLLWLPVVQAQPKVRPPAAESQAERCELMLASGDFDNRYEMIGVMIRVTACSLRDLIDAEVYQREVGPRLSLYIRQCYTPDEQPYLRGVVQRGVVQNLPYLSEAGCGQALDRVLGLQPPAEPARTE